MTDTVSAFRPDWISAPGDTIEDIIDERGWTQAELAERTGFTRKHVNDLVKGRARVTPDAAERLSRVLGSTTQFWLVREAQYRSAQKRAEDLQLLERWADWLQELPVSWMVKRGWIPQRKRKGEQVEECLRFFEVASVDAWRETYAAPLTAFRASGKFEKKLGAVAAWLRYAERKATGARIASYNAERFRQALRELRSLTNEPEPSAFVPTLVDTCARHGVAVVFAPAPPGCPASGATRWLTADKAMLLLSLRHRSNDHLWFTFFHEAGHLLLHGKKILFVEGLDGLANAREAEADAFARDLLIPPSHAKRLYDMPRPLSKAAVRDFAGTVGIAPGIVVGRLQKEKVLPWTHMNDLKVRYAWVDEESANG